MKVDRDIVERFNQQRKCFLKQTKNNSKKKKKIIMSSSTTATKLEQLNTKYEEILKKQQALVDMSREEVEEEENLDREYKACEAALKSQREVLTRLQKDQADLQNQIATGTNGKPELLLELVDIAAKIVEAEETLSTCRNKLDDAAEGQQYLGECRYVRSLTYGNLDSERKKIEEEMAQLVAK
jgi:chromosome segregation ATPase